MLSSEKVWLVRVKSHGEAVVDKCLQKSFNTKYCLTVEKVCRILSIRKAVSLLKKTKVDSL